MKTAITIVFIIFANAIFAQPGFEEITFADALTAAKAKGKMIFVQYESADCDECNEVAYKGVSAPEVAKKINDIFIPIKINLTHTDRDAISLQYDLSPTSFGILFLDMNGALVSKFLQSTTRYVTYLEQIDLALYKLGESINISYLESDYKNGNRNIDFLETLLSKRMSLSLSNDDLLDEYVKLLPVDSLKSIRTLVFIAQLAPGLYSYANFLMRRDHAMFTLAWRTLPNQARVSINNSVIYKSIKRAVKERREGSAMGAAMFAKQVYGSNVSAGQRAHDYWLLSYYEKTDTAKFLMLASKYYENYFMTVTLDSLKKIDSLGKARMLAKVPSRDSMVNGKLKQVKSIAYSPIGQYYSNALNNGAFNFYQMTNDPQHLALATKWAERALVLYKKPPVIDTYARLLYKQGQKEKAIKMETEAIEMWKDKKLDFKYLYVVLEKMKKNESLD
ncbi:MAG: hypothetical protein ABIO05_02590 [Ferruginibacter sp.]